MRKLILSLAAVAMSFSGIQAQCTTFDGGPYIDLGVAPCAQAPVTAITAFEAWASESYILTGVTAGVQYTFDICGGTGGTAWPAEFTIIAPSGAIDASGTDAGSNCQITWTASESGDYELGISEVGFCPGGVNVTTNNGFPRISANSGPIPNCVTSCVASALSNTNSEILCPGESAPLALSSTNSIPTGGGEGIKFVPVGGSGALGGSFVLSGVAFPSDIDNDLGGTLSFNGFPPFLGLWEAKAVVFSDAADTFGSVCDSSDVKVFNFLASGAPGCDPVVCEAGALTDASDQAVCPGEDVTLSVTGASVPVPGEFLWYFADTTEAGTDTLLINFGGSEFVGDLNGVLAASAIDTLDPGTYLVFGVVEDVAAATFCDFTDDAFFLTIYDESDPECGGGGCQAPTDLDVIETGFGTSNPRIKGAWTNPEGTTDCQVRGGRINPTTVGTGSPAFANTNNLVGVNQTTGTEFTFNIALYNNPNINFNIGQTYGYEVRCLCAGSTEYSDWAPLVDGSTFTVPEPPAEIILSDDHYMDNAQMKSLNVSVASKVAPVTRISQSAVAVDKKVIRVSDEQNAPAQLEMFPNPASQFVNLVVPANAENVDIRVIDMTGRVVLVKQSSQDGMFNMDISTLNTGYYIVEMNADGNLYHGNMMVK